MFKRLKDDSVIDRLIAERGVKKDASGKMLRKYGAVEPRILQHRGVLAWQQYMRSQNNLLNRQVPFEEEEKELAPPTETPSELPVQPTAAIEEPRSNLLQFRR